MVARLLPLLLAAMASAQTDDPAALRQRAGELISQGKYADAEAALNRAIAAQESATGQEDLSVAGPLSDLGALYRAENRLADAQKLYERALAIHKKAQGEDSAAQIPDLKSL